MSATHSTDYLLVVGKMCLAGLTAIDLGTVEVDVVSETHGDGAIGPRWRRTGRETDYRMEVAARPR